ncbi:MAG: ribose-phosphate pyrophosphokinae [Pseudomonadota bacterium]|jgi:ribose-phosphate pyrophosphokinase
MNNELIVFSGNANRALAESICRNLGTVLGQAMVGNFSDGETRVELQSNVRGRDVFIVQPTCAPANQHIMEALIMADACRRSSAQRVTLVTPYFGYGRQERKNAPRTPITAKLIADLFETAGYNRILTLELHTSAIQGFFNIPVDHLFAKPVFAEHLAGRPELLEDLVVVSPDAGGVERARALAKLFNTGLAIVDKRRDRPNESHVMNVIGEVKGRNCLIVDDICDTGGSLTKAADTLAAQGAKAVYAVISHPVLSGPALERIEASALKELICTDSIPLSEDAKKSSKIRQLSISSLFAEAIRRIHNSDSVSSLFV